MKSGSNKLFYIITGIFLVTGIYLYFLSTGKTEETIFPLTVSRSINQWHGSDIPMDSETLALISPDAMVFREYVNKKERRVTLYAGFYSNMDKSDLAHTPLVCYTGQGWQYEDRGTQRITISKLKKEIPVSVIFIRKGIEEQLVFYWLQSRKYTSNSFLKMRIRLFLDKLFGSDTQNFFIRISTPITQSDYKTPEATLAHFVNDVYPEIYAYFHQ